MKSIRDARCMYRAAWNNTNFEMLYVYDEERDESYRWPHGNRAMRRSAARLMGRRK